MKRKTFLTAVSLLPVFKAFSKKPSTILDKVCKTQRDQEGPFYKKGSPMRNVIEKNGTPLTIQGRILKAEDCTTPIVNATVDIWHCDSQGEYDNDGYKCRGTVQSDSHGN